MLVTLPIVLLLLDYWPLNRFECSSDKSRTNFWRLLVEKVPLFAVFPRLMRSYVRRAAASDALARALVAHVVATEKCHSQLLHLRLADGMAS